jgi:serine/threonine protein kinase/tetratricopeptide (TPR) repeat protein
MPIDFQRIQGVFQAVAELPTAERAAALERECRGDAELRRCAEALLKAHDDSRELPAADPEQTGWPTRPPASGELPAAEQQSTEAYMPTVGPGQIFAGRYKLLQQIGEGGMGTVWMADQTEPVKRRVAVKLIRVERGQSKTILSRFEAERQAIALMDHPHIARLLDAGEAPPARAGGAPTPFFVMELVKGVPLTDFCDAHKLGIPERLQLFMQVCAAVQHAHQKGIIHRDLKPSNILVESHDGKPVPKIIDFGLAKATSGLRLTENTLFTAFGSMMGTPLYMAPEQANFNALDVDTRADIYALGIILYELLTGSTPMTRATLKKAALDEMMKLIREQEVPTPSSRLSSAESAPSVAANRQTEPTKLGRFVKGELDWIVLKSLAKERDRRYETAVGFAKDIERFLNHEPVTAGPPSAGYRLRKFVRRNRGPVLAAGLVLLALVIGITGTTWGLLLAVAERDAKDAALKAEQQAREDETKARQQAFAALRSMTEDVVERKFAQGTVLTEDDRAFLRGIIAQFDAFAAIKGDDAGSRAFRAEGRLKVGVMRHKLGELQEAQKDNDEGVSILKQLAVDFPTRPDIRRFLAKGLYNRGILLRATGRHKEAEQDFDQALAIQKELAAEFPSRTEFRHELAVSQNSRALILHAKGRLKEAERVFGEALSIQKQLTADFPSRIEFRQDLARVHYNLGILLSDIGRLKEAEQNYDQALSIQKQLAADFPSRPDFRHQLALSHDNRGIVLRATGRPKEAEQDFDQALAIQKQLAAEFLTRPDFRYELARTYGNRGAMLNTTDRLKEAEKDYERALSIQKQLVADFPTRPEFRIGLADSHNNRGSLLADTGRLPESEKEYEQALSIRKQLTADFPTAPEFRQELASSYNNRGNLLNKTGRFEEAEQDYNQALSLQKQLAADFPNQPGMRNALANTCFNLALLLHNQKNWAAAKRLLLEGRPHHLAALKANPRHPTYRQIYRNHLNLLTLVHAGLLEQGDAVRSADAYRDLGWDPPGDAYTAACSLGLCVPIVAKHDNLDDKQRNEAAQFYGDAAMKFLREAVSKGWKDVPLMKKDTDLDPVREREDFKKLIEELERKEK